MAVFSASVTGPGVLAAGVRDQRATSEIVMMA
jgi:hypothetical protein